MQSRLATKVVDRIPNRRLTHDNWLCPAKTSPCSERPDGRLRCGKHGTPRSPSSSLASKGTQVVVVVVCMNRTPYNTVQDTLQRRRGNSPISSTRGRGIRRNSATTPGDIVVQIRGSPATAADFGPGFRYTSVTTRNTVINCASVQVVCLKVCMYVCTYIHTNSYIQGRRLGATLGLPTAAGISPASGQLLPASVGGDLACTW
ncbi:hypothetical protein L209DRAFT_210060 [Thermothelomyces heterothallicus CBS 203.75]